MQPRVLAILALFASPSLLTALPFAEAQVSVKECTRACEARKEACRKSFATQAQDAQRTCAVIYKAAKPACGGDNGCRKTAKKAFQRCKGDAKKMIKARAGECKDINGSKSCKKCCKGDDPASCEPIVCGDGQTTGQEECDNAVANSDTTPDACRTTCKQPICGDGVTDTERGEECDDGDANSNATPDTCRTTCKQPICRDDVVDPSNDEECDGNDNVCARGKCGAGCECLPDCGNNRIDPGEQCDGTDDAACTCLGSCLSNCACSPAPTLAFTTVAPGDDCGRINDDPAGTGNDLIPYGASLPQLDCGVLYIGGGDSAQPPSPTPDGATSIFNVTCSDPAAIALGATTSTDTGSNETCTDMGCFFGPPLPIPNEASPAVSTCVVNAIAGQCLGGVSAGRACASDRDCFACVGGSRSGSFCINDGNCPNGGVCQRGGTCTPRFAGGSLDGTAGTSTTTLPLRVAVQITDDLQPEPGIQPCPTCTNGRCDSGANSAGLCTTTTSLRTSHDCPAKAQPLAPFGVDLSPLSTGNPTKTAALGDGDFCGSTTGQRSSGAFGQFTANFIETKGSPAGDLTRGASLAAIQASVFCIPSSGSTLVDSVADLPGPGAVTLKGSSRLLP